jgi:hypothetical protein
MLRITCLPFAAFFSASALIFVSSTAIAPFSQSQINNSAANDHHQTEGGVDQTIKNRRFHGNRMFNSSAYQKPLRAQTTREMENVKTTNKPTQPKLKISIAIYEVQLQNNFKKDHSSKLYPRYRQYSIKNALAVRPKHSVWLQTPKQLSPIAVLSRRLGYGLRRKAY